MLSRGVGSLVLAVALASTLSACAGAPAPAAKESPSRAPSTSEPESARPGFDPLSFEEPELRVPPPGPTTRDDLEESLQNLPEAYTYAMRTGFGTQLRTLTPEFINAPFGDDFMDKFSRDLHAEMDASLVVKLRSRELVPYETTA